MKRSIAWLAAICLATVAPALAGMGDMMGDAAKNAVADAAADAVAPADAAAADAEGEAAAAADDAMAEGEAAADADAMAEGEAAADADAMAEDEAAEAEPETLTGTVQKAGAAGVEAAAQEGLRGGDMGSMGKKGGSAAVDHMMGGSGK